MYFSEAAADRPAQRRLVRLSAAAAIWGLWYAVYRGYYAAGGTAFLTGTIRAGSQSQFQAINLAGALVIAVAAVLPLAALPFWSRSWGRRVLLVLCWVVAVGCCMHALVDILERILSLAGVIDIDYPDLWASIDRRRTDLQDLFFNEPWFLLEGLAYGALGWTALGPGRTRRRWTATGAVAIAALTALGALTVLGVIGKAVVA